jgi:mitofilin
VPPNPKAVQDKKPTPPASIDDVGESSVLQDKVPTPPPPPPPPAPKKKGFFRRLRNFVFTLMVLGAVGFAGGVWYSRFNDKFHDLFTEYVPFGEQAVLYLEEMEFKKRFPHSRGPKPRQTEQIRIPAQSGASWRVADSGEPASPQSSASPVSRKAAPKPVEEPVPQVSASTPTKSADKSGPTKDKEVAKPDEKPKTEVKPETEAKPNSSFKAPEVNEPSKFPPLQPIDLLQLADARDPVVQDLVHMLNDLILVINADGAHGKYGTTINKAKEDVKKVGGKLRAMRAKVEKQSADAVREKVTEFDKAATELVSRVEKAMLNQELQWREEFEGEMSKVRESYDERAKLLLERERKVNEEKLKNQLLEQAIALKKEFVDEVQARVEKEREGRLGQLDELSSAVSDLEKLSLGWNDVVDSTLKTQQLHVAVEAVRAKLQDATHPLPFVKELVALKEIASDNSTVNAAIGSINPSAYQRGIPTPSQLIDRFRRVASEVRKASLLPNDAGVASHASSWVLSKMMFKKEGLPEGNDVESVLTRTQIFLEEGDLDNAAREMNGLDGWAKTLSKDWLAEVRKVLEVQQALDVS